MKKLTFALLTLLLMATSLVAQPQTVINTPLTDQSYVFYPVVVMLIAALFGALVTMVKSYKAVKFYNRKLKTAGSQPSRSLPSERKQHQGVMEPVHS